MEDIKKAVRVLEQSIERLEVALLQTKKEKKRIKLWIRLRN